MLRLRQATNAVTPAASIPQGPALAMDGTTRESSSAPGRASMPRRSRPVLGSRSASSRPPARRP
uniref:Uncharacterized protein n=1 Tax=Megalodesulfovibrio gigas TaxID=879 RepID=Q9AME4_MEGGA|nr:unknown [Megalodesulfovibrio gigas]